MNKETVYGLYDQGCGTLICPEAYSHPAKYSRKLIYWIVKTGIERSWWKPGETSLLDPFGGVGLGGIAAAAYGLQWIGVELEERFVALARQNYALHEAEWRGQRLPLPRILQGDSRELGRIVRDSYGTTPRQLGAMPMGAISSPPYANRVDDSGTGPVAEKNGRYGESDGQIGNLRLSGITSPPFTEAQSGGGILKNGYQGRPDLPPDFLEKRHCTADTAALSTENIASLPIGGVTSPPYEDSVHGRNGISREEIAKYRPGNHSQATSDPTYGVSDGQIGQEAGETYWEAISLILAQLHDLFPPGGHLAWIVKSFVRDKAIVDLPSMTLALMLRQGWEPVVWISTSLISEGTQGSMVEEVPEYQKARKSFFRRLAEKKGSPRIDEEVVLVVKRRAS